MKFSYQLTKKNIYDFFRLKNKYFDKEDRKGIVFIKRLILLLGTLTAIDSGYKIYLIKTIYLGAIKLSFRYFLPIIMILSLYALFYLLPVMLTKFATRNPENMGLINETEVELGDGKIMFKNNSHSVTYTLNKLHKIRITREFVLFYLTDDELQIFPKTSFSIIENDALETYLMNYGKEKLSVYDF